ncbi:fam-m protein [Plasmodium brasilianum]|nr:fam-m protein [Plasmodium brasilianum]
MEQRIKLLFFIKFSKFMLLIWICHFYNDISSFNNILEDNLNLIRKLEIRNYRLLAKYKKKKDLNIVSLKEDIADNRECEKKAIYNNENVFIKKKKQSNRCPLNKAQYYTEFVDYNNGIFDGKYFHFEKKWIKKKDYDSFLEKKRRMRDIKLKKIKFRSYGFGVFIFFLFFLFGIGLPILYGLNYLEKVLSPLDSLLQSDGVDAKMYSFLILFGIVIIILSVIILVSIPKILRNNEKYKKIKYMTERNE